MSMKSRVRPVAFAVLRKRLEGTRQEWAKGILWHLVKRIDDRESTYRRRLMRELCDVEVGRLTYGAFKIDGSILAGSRIGAFCSVAPGVRLGSVEHPLDWVSQHPFLWLRNRGYIARNHERFEAELSRPVVIEDDVWLGANALVSGGVRVGRGAVVGAGAVVTRDVEPYTIVAGVPARQIGERLPPDQARALAEIDWPSWDDERLAAEIEHFRDVDAFLERHAARTPVSPARS